MGNAYKWRLNVYEVDANDAAAEFERIYNKSGELLPEDIVNESRPEDAVLHNEFEWRDEVAAENYRREQARKMIGNLTVTFCEEQKEPTRAYVTVTKAIGVSNSYEPIQVVLKDENKREKMFGMAMQDLKAFRKKYDTLGELAELFEKIDTFLLSNAG